MNGPGVARGCGKSGMRLAALQKGEVILPLGMIDESLTERPNGFVYIIGIDLANGEDQTVWRKANPNV